LNAVAGLAIAVREPKDLNLIEHIGYDMESSNVENKNIIKTYNFLYVNKEATAALNMYLQSHILHDKDDKSSTAMTLQNIEVIADLHEDVGDDYYVDMTVKDTVLGSIDDSKVNDNAIQKSSEVDASILTLEENIDLSENIKTVKKRGRSKL
jgi:hypothetical protein